MNAISVQVIPAKSGFYCVYENSNEKDIFISGLVIAWKIEIHHTDNNNQISICVPITVDGDPSTNCIGVMNPDGTVTVFEESTFRSLNDLRRDRNYPIVDGPHDE